MRRLLTALIALVLLGGVTSAAMAGPSATDAPGPKKDNPNPPDQLPGCNPSDQQPNKCDGDSGGGGGGGGGGHPTGNCANGVDDEGDGFTDSADPDCQLPGCLPSNLTPKKCNETTDNSPPSCEDNNTCPPPPCDDNNTCPPPPCEDTNTCPPPPADPCSSGGLLTDKTIGQTLWDGGLQIPPLTEDPDADGVLTGPISKAADGTPLQPVFYEVGCAGDLLIDGSVGGDL
jgi:hypothetical protein